MENLGINEPNLVTKPRGEEEVEQPIPAAPVDTAPQQEPVEQMALPQEGAMTDPPAPKPNLRDIHASLTSLSAPGVNPDFDVFYEDFKELKSVGIAPFFNEFADFIDPSLHTLDFDDIDALFESDNPFAGIEDEDGGQVLDNPGDPTKPEVVKSREVRDSIPSFIIQPTFSARSVAHKGLFQEDEFGNLVPTFDPKAVLETKDSDSMTRFERYISEVGIQGPEPENPAERLAAYMRDKQGQDVVRQEQLKNILKTKQVYVDAHKTAMSPGLKNPFHDPNLQKRILESLRQDGFNLPYMKAIMNDLVSLADFNIEANRFGRFMGRRGGLLAGMNWSEAYQNVLQHTFGRKDEEAMRDRQTRFERGSVTNWTQTQEEAVPTPKPIEELVGEPQVKKLSESEIFIKNMMEDMIETSTAYLMEGDRKDKQRANKYKALRNKSEKDDAYNTLGVAAVSGGIPALVAFRMFESQAYLSKDDMLFMMEYELDSLSKMYDYYQSSMNHLTASADWNGFISASKALNGLLEETIPELISSLDADGLITENGINLMPGDPRAKEIDQLRGELDRLYSAIDQSKVTPELVSEMSRFENMGWSLRLLQEDISTNLREYYPQQFDELARRKYLQELADMKYERARDYFLLPGEEMESKYMDDTGSFVNSVGNYMYNYIVRPIYNQAMNTSSGLLMIPGLIVDNAAYGVNELFGIEDDEYGASEAWQDFLQSRKQEHSIFAGNPSALTGHLWSRDDFGTMQMDWSMLPIRTIEGLLQFFTYGMSGQAFGRAGSMVSITADLIDDQYKQAIDAGYTREEANQYSLFSSAMIAWSTTWVADPAKIMSVQPRKVAEAFNKRSMEFLTNGGTKTQAMLEGLKLLGGHPVQVGAGNIANYAAENTTQRLFNYGRGDSSFDTTLDQVRAYEEFTMGVFTGLVPGFRAGKYRVSEASPFRQQQLFNYAQNSNEIVNQIKQDATLTDQERAEYVEFMEQVGEVYQNEKSNLEGLDAASASVYLAAAVDLLHGKDRSDSFVTDATQKTFAMTMYKEAVSKMNNGQELTRAEAIIADRYARVFNSAKALANSYEQFKKGEISEVEFEAHKKSHEDQVAAEGPKVIQSPFESFETKGDRLPPNVPITGRGVQFRVLGKIHLGAIEQSGDNLVVSLEDGRTFEVGKVSDLETMTTHQIMFRFNQQRRSEGQFGVALVDGPKGAHDHLSFASVGIHMSEGQGGERVFHIRGREFRTGPEQTSSDYITFEGDETTVRLTDDNGNLVEIKGEVAETIASQILENEIYEQGRAEEFEQFIEQQEFATEQQQESDAEIEDATVRDTQQQGEAKSDAAVQQSVEETEVDSEVTTAAEAEIAEMISDENIDATVDLIARKVIAGDPLDTLESFIADLAASEINARISQLSGEETGQSAEAQENIEEQDINLLFEQAERAIAEQKEESEAEPDRPSGISLSQSLATPTVKTLLQSETEFEDEHRESQDDAPESPLAKKAAAINQNYEGDPSRTLDARDISDIEELIASGSLEALIEAEEILDEVLPKPNLDVAKDKVTPAAPSVEADRLSLRLQIQEEIDSKRRALMPEQRSSRQDLDDTGKQLIREGMREAAALDQLNITGPLNKLAGIGRFITGLTYRFRAGLTTDLRDFKKSNPEAFQEIEQVAEDTGFTPEEIFRYARNHVRKPRRVRLRPNDKSNIAQVLNEARKKHFSKDSTVSDLLDDLEAMGHTIGIASTFDKDGFAREFSVVGQTLLQFVDEARDANLSKEDVLEMISETIVDLEKNPAYEKLKKKLLQEEQRRAEDRSRIKDLREEMARKQADLRKENAEALKSLRLKTAERIEKLKQKSREELRSRLEAAELRRLIDLEAEKERGSRKRQRERLDDAEFRRLLQQERFQKKLDNVILNFLIREENAARRAEEEKVRQAEKKFMQEIALKYIKDNIKSDFITRAEIKSLITSITKANSEIGLSRAIAEVDYHVKLAEARRLDKEIEDLLAKPTSEKKSGVRRGKGVSSEVAHFLETLKSLSRDGQRKIFSKPDLPNRPQREPAEGMTISLEDASKARERYYEELDRLEVALHERIVELTSQDSLTDLEESELAKSWGKIKAVGAAKTLLDLKFNIRYASTLNTTAKARTPKPTTPKRRSGSPWKQPKQKIQPLKGEVRNSERIGQVLTPSEQLLEALKEERVDGMNEYRRIKEAKKEVDRENAKKAVFSMTRPLGSRRQRRAAERSQGSRRNLRDLTSDFIDMHKDIMNLFKKMDFRDNFMTKMGEKLLRGEFDSKRYKKESYQLRDGALKDIFGKNYEEKIDRLRRGERIDMGVPHPTYSGINLTFNQTEALYLWQMWKNPKYHVNIAKLIAPKNIEGEESYDMDRAVDLMEEIDNYLDPRLKDYGNWEEQVYFPHWQPLLNKVYKNLMGTDMTFEDFYTGRVYLEESETDMMAKDPDKLTAILDSFGMTLNIPGSIKARSQNSRKIKVVDQFVATMEYEHQIIGKWAAFAEIYSEMDRLLSNPDFKKAVQSNDLQDTYDNIKHLIQAYFIPTKTQDFLNSLMSNYYTAKIGANPSTGLKQTASILFAPGVNPTGFNDFVSKFFSLTVNPSRAIEVYRTLMRDSAMIWSRYRSPEEFMDQLNSVATSRKFGEIKKRSTAAEKWRKIVKWGMLPVKGGDFIGVMSNMTIYECVYQSELAKNGGDASSAHMEALFQFEKAVEATQQSSSVFRKDVLQTTEKLKYAFAFQTALRQQLRQAMDASMELIRAAKGNTAPNEFSVGQNVYRLLANHVFVPVLIEVIGQGITKVIHDDDDKREDSMRRILRAALIGNLNTFFVIGAAIDGLSRELIHPETLSFYEKTSHFLDDSKETLPALSLLADLGKAAHKVAEDYEDIDSWVKLAHTLLSLTGAPSEQLQRWVENFMAIPDAEDPGEVVLRFFNYTERIIDDLYGDKGGSSSGSRPKQRSSGKATEGSKPSQKQGSKPKQR